MHALSNRYNLHLLQGECCARTSRIQGCLDTFVGKILNARREDENSHDRHAVAVIFDSCTVGHLPQEYSRIAWHFLQHGGKISCKITGRKWHSLGLVVPCVYKFQGKEKLVVRL